MTTRKYLPSLFAQVLIAILLGVAMGYFDPVHAVMMNPLGQTFIRLIKMIIAPVIFCTVVTGIANMEDLKKVGKMGGKAILYFEVMTTAALFIGLFAVKLIRPGVGLNKQVSTMDLSTIANYTKVEAHHSVGDTLINIIPDTVVGAFAKGDILQVLFLAILVGSALSLSGTKSKPVIRAVETVSTLLFKIVDIIMLFAPIGAFGAMAYTVGSNGIGSLTYLAELMGSFYLTCIIFILGVLGLVGLYCGFNIFKFIRYIRDELTMVLGTSSSETALPSLMHKLEYLGCAKPVVGLVVPTGYSFNLDGSCIYFTMGAIFIAQATNTHLSTWEELSLLGVTLLTSKGAAGVTGSGLVILAATLSSFGTIPIAGLSLIVGIDRFMSQARALTNIVGNGVATIVISKWENELDYKRMDDILNRRIPDREEE